MAYGATTLQFADDKLRVLFGMTVPQTVAVVGAWQGVLHLEPHLLGGFGGVAAGGLVLGVCKLTDGVRREPRLAHLGGYLVRLVLGPRKTKETRHIILEVDGYTRDALTEEEQDTRLANRLQTIIASIGPGGAARILVTNNARDHHQLVRELRESQRPVGRNLAELGDRAVERLAARGMRETDIRFYLVLYEPKVSRRAPWWLRLMRRLPLLSVVARRLFGAGTSSQLLLANVAAETQTRLRAMGLASRVVPAVKGDAARPLTAGEMGNACRLACGRYAASFSLLTPPARTDPGWLDRLVTLRGPYRLAVWAHGTDPNRERTRLQTRNRQTGLHLLTASAGVGEKSAQFTEAEDAMMRLRQPNQAMIKAGVYVTCIADTAEDAIARAQQGLLVMESPAPGVFHQYPLAASTLPGHDVARCCWRMDAETVANMYPFNRTNPSTEAGLALGETDRGELVRLDPGDESLRNALCVIFGLSGMGKCVTPDTLVWSKGLQRFGDLWGASSIQGPHTVDRVRGWYDDGERDGYRVETESGFVIDGTPAHRLWVRDDSGYEGWKRLGDLTGDEYIGLARGVADWGDADIPLDEAYALGLVVADGCFSTTGGQRDVLQVDKHPLVLEAILPVLKRWRQAAGNTSVADVRITRHNERHGTAVISAPHLHAWLTTTYGMPPAHSYDKEVPLSVLCGTRDVVRAFLRGYFDGDGYCNTMQGLPINVAVSTASAALAAQVQQLLLGLGVYAALRVKPVPTHLPAHIVAVRDREAFAREVGFTRYGLRKDLTLVALLERPRNTNVDTVPGMRPLLRQARGHRRQDHGDAAVWTTAGSAYCAPSSTCNPSYAMLRRIPPTLDVCPIRSEIERIVDEHRVWTRIRSISPSHQRRIDCEVEGSHAFVGNGMINHNTLLTQKIIKAWRLGGGPVTILDRSGHYRWLASTIGGVTVRTAEEMEALPLTEKFVIVDLTTNDFNPALRAAVDRHVQSKVHDRQMLFVVEEAWQLEYLDSALWVMDLAKRGRHWGGFVWWVTHDPKELLNHPQLVSMFDQAAVKVAFALVDSEGVASRLGSAMGLTPKEIETVKALAQGECYLMRHNALDGSIVRGKVSVDASDEELWLFESDPRHWQYKRREQEIAACGGDVWRAVKTLVATVPFRPQEKEAVAAVEEILAGGRPEGRPS